MAPHAARCTGKVRQEAFKATVVSKLRGWQSSRFAIGTLVCRGKIPPALPSTVLVEIRLAMKLFPNDMRPPLPEYCE